MRYFAKHEQLLWRSKLQVAWAYPADADAKRALDRLACELRLVNKSAATILAEGLDEVLTLCRRSVFPELGVNFKTTNLIESVMARREAKTQHVTYWRTSDPKMRRCRRSSG